MVTCVPKVSPNPPNWDQLFETAAAQDGHFTTEQATEAGYSSQLLAHYVRTAKVRRVLRGVYRIGHYPVGTHDDLVALLLWTGDAGTVSHESALGLHQLSDALPAKVDVTLPVSWKSRRVRYPAMMRVHFAAVISRDRAWFGPVRVTKPLRTVQDCIADHVQPELVRQAIRDGVRRGLFTRQDLVAARRTRRAT